MGRRIGVFGGTFDPIHVGHLIIAAELCQSLELDTVLFVLSPRPPHKTDQDISADGHRLAMLQLAIAPEPSFRVSTIEVTRDGLSYTVDTLGSLRAAHPDDTLVFLMGEDSLRDFPTWREPGRIATLADIGVATRPGVVVDLASILAAVPELAGRVTLVPVPEIGVSSRDVRARVATGRTIQFQVTRAVERYIVDNGLYQSDPH